MKPTLLFVSFSITLFSFFPKKIMVKLLEDEESFVTTKVDSIPTTVFSKMHKIVGEEFAFASFGEDFNESDAVENEKTPFRRLIFSVSSTDGKEWLIYYEKGGRSHNAYLSYAVLDRNDDVKCIYNLSPNSKKIVFEKGELIELLKSESFTIIYNNGKPLKKNYVEF